jgi:hypothetical protein
VETCEADEREREGTVVVATGEDDETERGGADVVETGGVDGKERRGVGVVEEEEGIGNLGGRGTEGASVVETGTSS